MRTYRGMKLIIPNCSTSPKFSSELNMQEKRHFKNRQNFTGKRKQFKSSLLSKYDNHY